MRYLCFLLIALTFNAKSWGQNASNTEPLYLRMMNDTAVHNFYDIQREFKGYFQNRDKGRGSGYNHFKRFEEAVASAFYPSGQMFNIQAKILSEYQSYVENFDYPMLPATYDPGNWISIGPSQYSLGKGWNGGIGRVNCIAFHPTNDDIVYAGTPAGGLWKYNSTWTPLTDGFPSIGVSGIAIDPTNTNHIYILTGDGDSGQTYSVGVLETNDGCITWHETGLSWQVPVGVRGFKLLMHPANHLILFCATNAGLYKTSDGGATWVKALNVVSTDIEFKPGTPSTVYTVSSTEFYRSTNTGDTWSHITNGLPAGGSSRIGIGVTETEPGYVYLIYGQSSNDNTRSGFMGCYRSTNSGTSFQLRSNTPNIFGYSSVGNDFSEQSSYDLSVAVCPSDADEIHFGGINCWESNDGGVNWHHTSFWNQDSLGEEYTHADIHALEFNPLNGYIFCGSDGGVFRSLNHANTWTDRSSGLVVTQFYRMGGTPQNVNLIAGGTQDNGCNTFRGGSVNTFVHDVGADGFECMINPDDSTTRYESTYSMLFKTTNNGSSWSLITPSFVNNDLWNVAWIMHPTTPATLYLGHDDIWRSTNSGTTWTALNTGNATGAKFRQIAHGVNNLNRIYGLTKFSVVMSNDAGSSWADITEGLPVESCNLSYIAVDPESSGHVAVCCLGYVGGVKVYESTNSGTTWTNISGSLPNVQARCIVFETGSNDRFYLGTDVGVFYRDDNTNDWVPFFNGLPNSPVNEMEINYNTNEIVAATFGRGYWKSKLYGHCPATYVLTPANNPGTSLSQFYAAYNYITSTRYVYSSYNSTVTYRGGNYVTLLPGFETQGGATFEATIGDCPSTTMAAPHSLFQRTTGILVPGSKGIK